MNDAKRLKSIIEKDRLLVSEETSEMIKYDLKNVLDEYFNLEEKIDLLVEAKKDEILITVTAKASAIKSFGIIK